MAQHPDQDYQQAAEAQSDRQDFNPRDHLMNVKGNQYLPVSARVMWFRNDHPDAQITQDLHFLDDGRAVVKCVVQITSGGSAVAYGTCHPNEFPDGFIEKACTKSLGRALGAMGYGTPEPDDDEQGQLADTPRGQYNGPQRQQPQQNRGAQVPRQFNNQQPPQSTANHFMATAPQKSRIQRLASEMQMPPDELEQLIRQHTGTGFMDMNKRQASGVIDLLEGRRANAQTQPARGTGPDPF